MMLFMAEEGLRQLNSKAKHKIKDVGVPLDESGEVMHWTCSHVCWSWADGFQVTDWIEE